MTNNTTYSSGITFGGLLTIAFTILKLTGYINWSWWWVLSPLWIEAALGILVVIIICIVLAIKRGDE